MRKNIFPLLLLSFLFLFVPKAYADLTTVTDEAHLFTTEEIEQLTTTAEEINPTFKGKLFIVTTDTNNEEPRDFADNFLRSQIGNDQNGSVLLLDMNQREIYISTSGNMIDYITDERLEEILDAIYDEMVDGDYFLAAQAYLEKTALFIKDGVPSNHYQVDEETGKITYYKTITPTEAIIALLIALGSALAFFIVVKSRYQLKSGTYRYPFMEHSKLNLSVKEDQLTNSFTTTRVIPKNTNHGSGGSSGGSTTHSSGGGTFGGGGRSF